MSVVSLATLWWWWRRSERPSAIAARATTSERGEDGRRADIDRCAVARQSGSKTIFVPMHLLQTDGASVGGSGGMGGNGGASGGSNTNVDRTMMLERMSEN